MRQSRFTEEQIIGVLKQGEAGIKTAEICRQHGISNATFYKWKGKYGGLEISEARRLRQLEDENRRLKQIVADLTLDKQMLQDVLKKSSEATATPAVGEPAAAGVSGVRAARLCDGAVAPHRLSLREPAA